MSKPLLFLLPGMDGTEKLVQIPKEYLSSHFTTNIVAYPKDIEYTYCELASYVETFLPEKEPFYILGESFGGPLALEIALRRKKQVLGIILSATFSSTPMKFAFDVPNLSNYFSLNLIPNIVLNYMFLNNDDKFKDLLHEILGSLNNKVIFSRLKEVAKLKNHPELINLKTPVLYLQGKNDNIVGAHNYDNIKKILTQTKKVVIDSGHLVLQSQPEDCKDAILNFLKENNK